MAKYATFAASCSALFLVVPVPVPLTTPSTVTGVRIVCTLFVCEIVHTDASRRPRRHVAGSCG